MNKTSQGFGTRDLGLDCICERKGQIISRKLEVEIGINYYWLCIHSCNGNNLAIAQGHFMHYSIIRCSERRPEKLIPSVQHPLKL